jgi:hypothetical protein
MQPNGGGSTGGTLSNVSHKAWIAPLMLLSMISFRKLSIATLYWRNDQKSFSKISYVVLEKFNETTTRTLVSVCVH